MSDPVTTPVEGFTPLRVKHVVRETPDAVSLVFDRPAISDFGYLPGQFVTLLVHVDGREHRRCYSMSSSPALDEDLRITVKRDRDGVVSNWLNSTAAAGDQLHVAPPQGRFVLGDQDRELVAFAGGSGITPVYSLLRSALETTDRASRLFYANRSRSSIIFADSLTDLEQRHRTRFHVRHHVDDDHGLVTAAQVEAFATETADADFYVCGPAPFMDTVEKALISAGVAGDRLRLERFTVSSTVDSPTAAASLTEEVTIELDRRTVTVPYRSGNTLLQTARMAGLRAPSSCETGSCGTCIARVTEGSAQILNNDALDDDEIADGWVVTCQSLPTSRTIRVVYD
ncbi:ferredoxin--NADP reductase [Mycobacterium sp. 21AC1]|uniref:ferredoxin--NADP reductase n=1 Tax=[Mycobacterium] appelbergii TaxID=2939269 RepID=UPI002938ED3C|nr:ferredoxin--NADP reductase [Mycobacterium sp. 21AC1]MDV3128573.1 ferredoxin--NADP reductase [Mycobacterium sp. 21AC1]